MDRRTGRRRLPIEPAEGGKRGSTMAIVFHGKHLHIDAHHPFWLWFAAMLAFLFAALWAKPIG